jgi:tetratricopeptide (TPR) repeat protein
VWAGLAGNFEDAERHARESVRLAERAGAPEAQAHFTAQLVAIRREQGRLDELLPQIARLAGGGPDAIAWRSVLPLAHLDAGDRARARAAFDRACGSPRPRGLLWLTATAWLCEAAVELGDAEGSERLYSELAPYADRLIQWTFTGNAGSVRRVLGRAAALAGRRDEASEHFERAMERHAALGAEALLARTRTDYGELLLQGTPADRGRAAGLLRAGAVTARRLGMARVAARA